MFVRVVFFLCVGGMVITSVRSLRSPFRATKSFPASQNITSFFAQSVFWQKSRTGLFVFSLLPRFVFVFFESGTVWKFVGYSTVTCSPIVGLALVYEKPLGEELYIFS